MVRLVFKASANASKGKRTGSSICKIRLRNKGLDAVDMDVIFLQVENFEGGVGL